MALPTDEQLMFGEGLKLTDSVSVIHPTLGQVVRDERYDEYLPYLMYTSEQVADILWCENHVLYKDLKSEWEFFLQQCLADAKSHDVLFCDGDVKYVEKDCLIINDEHRNALNYFLSLDCEYVVYTRKTGNIEQHILYSLSVDGDTYTYNKGNFLFTETFYNLTMQYLRKINCFDPKYYWQTAGNRKALKTFLEREYKDRQRHKDKPIKQTITLGSIVSGLIARGQPYDKIQDYPIYMIFDLRRRFEKIDEYKGTMQGIYSGCIDTQKHPVDWNKVNWAAVVKNK